MDVPVSPHPNSHGSQTGASEPSLDPVPSLPSPVRPFPTGPSPTVPNRSQSPVPNDLQSTLSSTTFYPGPVPLDSSPLPPLHHLRFLFNLWSPVSQHQFRITPSRAHSVPHLPHEKNSTKKNQNAVWGPCGPCPKCSENECPPPTSYPNPRAQSVCPSGRRVSS